MRGARRLTDCCSTEQFRTTRHSLLSRMRTSVELFLINALESAECAGERQLAFFFDYHIAEKAIFY
jgi:hypothetical protein